MKSSNLLVLALALSFATAYAQEEEQVLNSDPINVDGYLADRPVTDGELEQIRSELRKQKTSTELNKEKAKDLGKLANQTDKLLDSQDQYIDQKIESTKAIKQFNKEYEKNQRKLECIMEELKSRDCDPYKSLYGGTREHKEEIRQEIILAQAAPAYHAPVVSTEISSGPAWGGYVENIKLLPYAGATSFSGKKEQIEAELAMGLRLESNINSRFSIGIGFNFAQLKTQDFANNGFNNQPYNQGYAGAYGASGREIKYRSMGLDLYGKFFITNGARFRPYLGAGLGYSRATMAYTDNQAYSQPGYAFGSEEYKNSYATGTIMAGSEIMITPGFGINLEAAYSTGLGNSLSSENSKNPFNSPDQGRLQQLGDEIINANALSMFVGAVVIF
ncbi:MAG TPA: outer membrane beta-barrel protein [Bacteriovoracaceae bacterium]|nr:outer membrane beta-barrel protein [Bacteriovoracaceae bacterium]